jgi:hypothetical protein
MKLRKHRSNSKLSKLTGEGILSIEKPIDEASNTPKAEIRLQLVLSKLTGSESTLRGVFSAL